MASLIGVGIHKDMVISKVEATKTEQGQSLNILFKKVGDQPQDSDSLDFLNSGEVSSGSSDVGKETNIRLYGINLVGFDGNEKSGDDLLNEVLAKQTQLNHLASPYLTADKVKAGWNLTKGLNVKSKSELVKAITLEANLYKVVDNLFTQFEELMKPVVGDNSKHVVVKFTRKSKTSNFPKLTDKYLDSQPFIAAADDTATVNKIKFSKWDIENGFDSNAQSLDSADASPADLAAQTQAANDVFGN